MKAQVIKQFGDASVFQSLDVAVPLMQPGHVLIKVAATSVNPIDAKIRSGAVGAIAPEFPAILHGDVAGVVEAIAEDVTQFAVGDEVFSCAGGVRGSGGALAEYMLADVRLIAKKPRSLTMLDAAALPLVCITAWEALIMKADLNRDASVLIHGGVGGVGHIAIQLAKLTGCKVATTVLKPQDVAIAKSLGADEVIHARDEEVEEYVARLTDGHGFNVVFDTVGGANLEKSFAAASINGQVVTTAARSTQDLTPMHTKSLSLHAVFMLLPLLNNKGREQHGIILSRVAEYIDEGKIKPLIDPNEFTLDTISKAHQLLESGQARGKIVVSIS